MNVPCSVPTRLLQPRQINATLYFDLGDGVGRGEGIDVGGSGWPAADPLPERYECEVPAELLERRVGTIDDGAKFGFYVEYWLAGERVHRSEGVHWLKGQSFTGPRYSLTVDGKVVHLVADDGTISGDRRDGAGIVRLPVAGLRVRKTEDDTPDSYVVAVEFFEPGHEEHFHRSVHVNMKRVPSLTGEQGVMS